MSSYYIIDAIQYARNLHALEEVEKWINRLTGKEAGYLAGLALLKRCELLISQYGGE